MSKFKVGDKVWCNGDVRIIKRVDEWENGEYDYYFNVDDELLNYERECDLELYKTPHERLLDLGWELVADNDQEITYQLFDDPFTFTYQLKIDKLKKIIDNRYCVFGKYTNITVIDLQLAKILVRYLEELE